MKEKFSAWFLEMVFFIVTALPFSTTAIGQNFQAEKIDKVRQFLKNYTKFGYAGSVLIVDEGKILLNEGFGMADVKLKIKNSPKTIFDIGSLTKQFTAAALLRLESEAKLKTTNPLSLYFTDLPTDKQGITIEQLLNHTAGFDSDFPFSESAVGYFENVGKAEAIKRIIQTELISAPGTNYSYSNMGYVLAAAIVEKVSGMSYQQYLSSVFFKPLNMQSTGFWGKKLPSQPRKMFAKSYDEKGREELSFDLSDTLWFDMGGGAVVSTTQDLYTWARAFNNGKVLTGKGFSKVADASDGYAYGWEIRRDSLSKHKFLYHGGNYLNYGSYLGFFLGQNTYFINLYNRGYQFFGAGHLVNLVAPKLLRGQNLGQILQKDSVQLPQDSEEDFALSKNLLTKYLLTPSDTIEVYLDKKLNQYFIKGIGQSAIDFITNAPLSERTIRQELNDLAVSMLEDIKKGNKTRLLPLLRRPDLEVPYFNSFTRVLDEFIKVRGGLDTIYSLGSIPIAYPVGAYQTAIALRKDEHVDVFCITFLNKKIQNTRGYDPKIFSSRFNKASNGFVAWSPIWLRNCIFYFKFEGPVAELVGPLGYGKAKMLPGIK